MSFALIPSVLIPSICSFLVPFKKMTSSEVREQVRQVVDFILINRECQEATRAKFKAYLLFLREIDPLVRKYTRYDHCYQNVPSSNPNPFLIDALFTGCTFGLAPTHMHFNQEIEGDIRKIITLTPQSLSSGIGIAIQGKNIGVTSLGAACINDNIPFRIIKFMLKHGADLSKIIITEEGAKGLDALKGHPEIINRKRLKAIKFIFKCFINESKILGG